MRRAQRIGRTLGVAAAVTAAALAGFVGAGLIYAGPRRLGERAPLASLRAIGGDDRGRDAASPHDIPPYGWWEILKRTSLRVARNRLMAESAAVTFYTLLAIFPALTAVVSLYGLFADPAAISALVDALSDLVPHDSVEMLRGQIHELVAHSPRSLTLGVAIGLVTALWSANQGSKALFESLNVIYRESEKRSYPRFVLEAYAFTLGAILFVMAAMIGVVLLPQILRHIGFSDVTQLVVRWARWPVILIFVGVFLASLYRFGPSRENPKWRWVSWGGVLATVSWVGMSFLFSWYVQRFGNFDRIYGSLGALVGFLFWIWLSTLVALCGAQLNSEMEHQTAVDTTTGPPAPLGLRGATQADTVA